MNFEKKDIEILRELARQKAEIAADPRNLENAKLWTNTNDLKMTKAPVYINELPWHEMNVDDELTILTSDPFLQKVENQLRKEIYSWKHLPGNMVVTPYIESPIVINNTGLGISEDVDIVKTDEVSSVVSRHFNIQIKCEDDIAKIKDPVVSIDNEKTEENFNALKEIFGDILEVRKVGVKGYWFTPWDNLIRWTGVQEALMDLMLEPEYIDKLVERFVDASLVELEQYKKLGLWASNNDNTRVGSGGYGYTSDLAKADEYLTNAPLNQLWGCGNAQIFSEVSPDMHWEFSLKNEIRWMKHFGLNYYGCCEPLHNKLHILEKIPNLRKISMSPWAKIEVAREISKDKYVLSCKPTPAVFAEDSWRTEQAKEDILKMLKASDGCSIELIMKDVSTVRYKPQRIWEWSKIALDTIDEYYG